jgi:DNA-binding response OmpR family regulator
MNIVQSQDSHPSVKDRKTARKKIVILSDDLHLSQSLSLFFGNEFDVQTVDSFTDVSSIVCSSTVDLLLVDFGLPEPCISKSLCAIRESGCTIPIVLMYVFHEKKKNQESEMRKYADAVFYKPVNILDVLGQIRIFLS